jgi:hypothetical protein
MPNLVRRSFFVDPRVIRKLRRALGVRSDAEAVRQVARWYVESESLKVWLRKTAGTLSPREFDHDEP